MKRNPTKRVVENMTHDSKKQYILTDGVPYKFLIKLGIMNEEGQVLKKHYSKALKKQKKLS